MPGIEEELDQPPTNIVPDAERHAEENQEEENGENVENVQTPPLPSVLRSLSVTRKRTRSVKELF